MNPCHPRQPIKKSGKNQIEKPIDDPDLPPASLFLIILYCSS